MAYYCVSDEDLEQLSWGTLHLRDICTRENRALLTWTGAEAIRMLREQLAAKDREDETEKLDLDELVEQVYSSFDEDKQTGISIWDAVAAWLGEQKTGENNE